MEEQRKTLKDYFDVLRRRKKALLISAGLFITISVLAAILWPPVYRSTATILIEQQDVPPDLVRSTVTSFATQRIREIQQRVLTRPNLTKIVEKYELYQAKRRVETSEEIAQRMYDDIAVELKTADVIDPRSGIAMEATIAFQISYNGEAPQVTQQVANELTNLFLEENLRNRTNKAKQTSAFLAAEAKRASENVAAMETTLADFKKTNSGRLPEQGGLNLQFMERTDKEIVDIDAQIRALESRRYYLEGELAQINPNTPAFSASGERILDPVSQLKVLRTEYAAASARYGEDHPDMIRTRREIAALEQQHGGSVEDEQEQAKELRELRTELALAQERYSEDHPDVVRLTRSISKLEQALQDAPARPERAIAAEEPENPAYITFAAQMQSTDSELNSLRERRAELKTKLADYEQRLLQTPEVERGYADLTRAYTNAVEEYRDIKAKLTAAELAQQLEKESKGERFSVIDPAQYPEEPIKPNRPAILLLGMALSVGSGLGFAITAENMDNSIRGIRSVNTALGAPPLAVVPYLESAQERQRQGRSRKLTLAIIVAAIILLLMAVHAFWIKLDVLWFVVMRRVGELFGG